MDGLTPPSDPRPAELRARFAELQQRLPAAWRADQRGSQVERTVIGLPSYSLDAVVLEHYAERLPALEQRYLFAILLLHNPHCRVVFVTSVDPPPYLVDYYVALLPPEARRDAHERLDIVSLEDPSPRPLSAKLLEQPTALARVREATRDRLAFIEPWNVTDLETAVAVALDVPLYGADPAHWPLATKRGGRRIFDEEGVPHPRGTEVRSVGDVTGALANLRLGAAVVKLDDSVSGDGNWIVRSGDDVARLPEWYVEALDGGGIVEELVTGEVRSPSVQLTITPDRDLVVLSTHDQVLGGDTGHVYQGCRFPADPAYAATITTEARKVGARLVREGVIGRFSVDFMVRRTRGGTWEPFALEINLRKGGTTHPYAAARHLTTGDYDETVPALRTANGRTRWYVATDNLVDPAWCALTGERVIAALHEAGLDWDRDALCGVIPHMLSGLPVDGRFGVTAIGTSPAHADELYARAAATVAALTPATSPTA